VQAAPEPTPPRPAATVILLRGGSERLEVLLVRRNPAARFMGGAWVFPGGAVDPGESHRQAAVRETAEEAGLALPDAAALIEFSRWITPAQIAVRYDTVFFLAPAPEGAAARPDGQETVDLGWYTPAGALETGLELMFPTVKHLELLAGFASARALLEWARGRTVEPVEPRLVMDGEVARVVLPGEPGYAC
jgi:8-oxo-dGTP pyrophosphatase MutT (NUDIX family)